MAGRKALAGALAAACLFLTGCLGADAEVYGQDKVLAYVDSLCAEPYRLVDVRLVAEEPDDVEYRFETETRGLRFTAHSYLSPIYFDATQTGFYSREISCDYVSAVRELYAKQVDEALSACAHYLPDHGWMYLLCAADVDGVVDAVLAADAVYQAELAYNDPSFLSENAAARVHVVWHASEEQAAEHSDWVNLTDLFVTGQNDREALRDQLLSALAQQIVDGNVTGVGDVPGEYFAGRHVSTLDTIVLNGEEMLYDDDENPAGPYLLTTEDYKYSWYSAEKESYMVPMDIGLTSDNMSYPMVVREYVRALGGDYESGGDSERYKSAWTIGPDSWTMTATYDGDAVRALTVKKNGRELDLDWVNIEDDPRLGATFCVGMPVEDFCELFGLTYEADEAARCLRFQSR